jgi:hypothetical protein
MLDYGGPHMGRPAGLVGPIEEHRVVKTRTARALALNLKLLITAARRALKIIFNPP